MIAIELPKEVEDTLMYFKSTWGYGSIERTITELIITENKREKQQIASIFKNHLSKSKIKSTYPTFPEVER